MIALAQAIAARIRGTPFKVDTVQMWQQPQGGGAITWTTEIWDVRPFSRRVQASNFCPRLLSPSPVAWQEASLFLPSGWNAERLGLQACPRLRTVSGVQRLTAGNELPIHRGQICQVWC